MQNNSDERKAPGRILWIDVAKGLAILMIVMSHVTRRGVLTDYLGSVGVVLFFFLGGITFHYHSDTRTVPMVSPASLPASIRFLVSKFKKYYLPYLAVGTFSILCYAVLGKVAASALDISKGDNSLPAAFFHLFYANSKNGCMKWNDSLWFIPAYLVAFILAAGIEEILAGILNQKKKRASAISAEKTSAKAHNQSFLLRILISLALFLLGAFLSQCLDAHLPWQLETALEMQLFFEAGIILKKYCQQEQTQAGQRTLLELALAILLMAASAFITTFDIEPTPSDGLPRAMSVRADVYPNFLLSYLILVLAVAAFCLLAMSISEIGKIEEKSMLANFIAVFGMASMEIMLFNKFFVLAAQIILKKCLPAVYSLVNKQSTLVALILSIPLAVLISAGCIILWKMVNRIPRKA